MKGLMSIEVECSGRCHTPENMLLSKLEALQATPVESLRTGSSSADEAHGKTTLAQLELLGDANGPTAVFVRALSFLKQALATLMAKFAIAATSFLAPRVIKVER